MALSISSDGKYICAAAPEKVGFSSNYGTSFSILTNLPNPGTPGVTPSFFIYKKSKIISNGYIYILFAKYLCVSKDNGNTFQTVFTNVGIQYFNDFSVSQNGNIIIIVTVNQNSANNFFYFSNNGGTSFTNIYNNIINSNFLDPSYNNGLVGTGFYRNCEISPDGYSMLTTIRYRVINVPGYNFFEVIALSMDQGNTWKNIGSAYITSSTLFSVILNPQTNYATNIYSSMVTTYNNWMSVSNCANYIFINGYVSIDKGNNYYPMYSGPYYNYLYRTGLVSSISTSYNGKYFIFNSANNSYGYPGVILINNTI